MRGHGFGHASLGRVVIQECDEGTICRAAEEEFGIDVSEEWISGFVLFLVGLFPPLDGDFVVAVCGRSVYVQIPEMLRCFGDVCLHVKGFDVKGVGLWTVRGGACVREAGKCV